MNKKQVSIVLLIIFIVTAILTVVNVSITDNTTQNQENKTLIINNKTVNYDKSGKCLDVVDGNTIQVYGVGKVQLSQIKIAHSEPKFTKSKEFVSKKCLGKTVYLDIDDKQPKDKYGRTLAIVYTNTTDINKELINQKLAEISYFQPSEFEKGEV